MLSHTSFFTCSNSHGYQGAQDGVGFLYIHSCALINDYCLFFFILKVKHALIWGGLGMPRFSWHPSLDYLVTAGSTYLYKRACA